jgi:aminoglycoside phosphotransferase/adenylate kinase family enzyme
MAINRIPGVPECYTIDNFLGVEECESLISLSESLGYAPKKSRRSGPAIRNNERSIHIPSDELIQSLEQRLRSFLMTVDVSSVGPGWKLAENFLNNKWRFNVYREGQEFFPHFDSGFAKRTDRRSLLSLIIYLNDDFSGGETCFYPDGQSRDHMSPGDLDRQEVQVQPKQGMAIVFPHFGVLGPRHSGKPIIPRPRAKFIIRTDIFYQDHQFSLENVLFGGASNLKRTLIIMGPPGSGKSTISKALADLPKWSSVNFGAAVRETGKLQTELGLEIQEFRKQRELSVGKERKPGAWLPDHLSLKILHTIFPQYSYQFLAIDGFPKMRSQSLLLERSDWFLLGAVYLKVSADVQRDRILNRGTSGDLSGRSHLFRQDDTLDGLSVRMVDWNQDTLPLVEQYAKRGELTEIDGELSTEEILEKIQTLVDARLYDVASEFFPDSIRELIKNYEIEKNNLSKKALVYRLKGKTEDLYLKLLPESRLLNTLALESSLLHNLREEGLPFNVPEILYEFKLTPNVTGLISRKLKGITLKEALKKYSNDHSELVRKWAQALAKLHSFRPKVSERFIERPIPVLLERAQLRLKMGLIKRMSFSTKYGSSEDINLELELEEVTKACNHLQFSLQYIVHGDPCAPNLIFDEDLKVVTGFIDNGAIGFSDNCWDLAIAAWSVGYNTSDEFKKVFFDEYQASMKAVVASYQIDFEKLSVMYRLARFIL